MTISVSVQKEVESELTPSELEITTWAQATQQNPLLNIELNVRITGKDEIRKLNKDYRGQDKATNVLSFVSDLPKGIADTDILADLVICADLVESEANEFNKPIRDRWAHMVVHGCLHVQGFDHENDSDRDLMEAEERKIMEKLQFSDPYQV